MSEHWKYKRHPCICTVWLVVQNEREWITYTCTAYIVHIQCMVKRALRWKATTRVICKVLEKNCNTRWVTRWGQMVTHGKQCLIAKSKWIEWQVPGSMIICMVWTIEKAKAQMYVLTHILMALLVLIVTSVNETENLMRTNQMPLFI